jgi:cell division protein FtsI (penicillin-binding protein 3)
MLRIGLFLAFAILAARLFTLQVLEHATYARQALKMVTQTEHIASLRGNIYDRYGTALAISSPSSLVLADDQQITDPAGEAKSMSSLVGIPTPKLTTMLSHHKWGYLVLRTDLDIGKAHKLMKLNPKGIRTFSSTQRLYPNGFLAKSIIGGISSQVTSNRTSTQGSAGLEYSYQSVLAGKAGLEVQLENGSGFPLPNQTPHVLSKPVPGRGLELTIDSALQFVTEQALGTELRQSGGYSGVAIVMDVRTGDILANASLVNKRVAPGPLTPITDWGGTIGVPGIAASINNLAFTEVYEPGSVFKIVPFSAALEANQIQVTTRFTVPYSMKVAGHVFHDAERHGIESLSAIDILAYSSNIGTIQIASHVGEAGLLAQVNRLGFGRTTDVNFLGESPGILKGVTNWSSSDIASLPIGQVDAVTPIQVLDAYNTIANGGVFVEPRLIRATVSESGHAVATPPSARHRALSLATSDTLANMLEQVVLMGTGTGAQVPGYIVAGKTGTSQIPRPGSASYIAGAYNASFVGFAPADHPVLSMLVLVERPRTAIFGGTIAAPVFQRVMSYALRHYQIPLSQGKVVLLEPGTKSTLGSDIT